ncbi:MAG: helix-hairpin-helix domain-containing protein [Kiritimatiellia bacterium]|nr:helix-hairpin-helix domain-containing protein [Kiritimatiellia bacterium]
MFKTIQGVMGEPENVVVLPVRLLLRSLPVPLRGPEWKEGVYPEASIELDKQTLLDQLRRGRVAYSLNELIHSLPAGWVKPDPEAVVEMNLADLVAALPPDLLRIEGHVDSDTMQAANMRDFFAPSASPPAMPSEPAERVPVASDVTPVAASAAADPSSPSPVSAAARTRRAPVPRPPIPNLWDGVDRQADAGAQTLDLNRASADEIATLPAMGPSSAKRLVHYRTQQGPFKSIYDLLSIPGVGRKVFCRMTGLNHRLRYRYDRHETLNHLLGLPPDARPTLLQVATRAAASIRAEGCILADNDGIVLAQSEGIGDDVEKMAALSPKLFRRTRRYLKQLSREPVYALALPTTSPPLLLVMSATGHMVVVQRAEGMDAEDSRKAISIAKEIDWLLSHRAVVRV